MLSPLHCHMLTPPRYLTMLSHTQNPSNVKCDRIGLTQISIICSLRPSFFLLEKNCDPLVQAVWECETVFLPHLALLHIWYHDQGLLKHVKYIPVHHFVKAGVFRIPESAGRIDDSSISLTHLPLLLKLLEIPFNVGEGTFPTHDTVMTNQRETKSGVGPNNAKQHSINI